MLTGFNEFCQATGENGEQQLVPYRHNLAALKSGNCHCYIPRDLRQDPGQEGDDTEQQPGNSQSIRCGPH